MLGSDLLKYISYYLDLDSIIILIKNGIFRDNEISIDFLSELYFPHLKEPPSFDILLEYHHILNKDIYNVSYYELCDFIKNNKWSYNWIQLDLKNKNNRQDTFTKDMVIEISKNLLQIDKLRFIVKFLNDNCWWKCQKKMSFIKKSDKLTAAQRELKLRDLRISLDLTIIELDNQIVDNKEILDKYTTYHWNTTDPCVFNF